jgi:DNA-binding CsgD family transcriptional regulator
MTTPTKSTLDPNPGGRGWAYAGTVLGALTSVAANIADAYVAPKDWHPTGPGQEWSPDIGAVLGAVFWPVALLSASETLARKRWANPVTRRVGVAAVLVVATAAAVISYQHMHALLQHYQESTLSATIGPLAIDGLMIVCSLALVAKDAPAERLEADTATAPPVPSTLDAEPSGSSPAPDPAPSGPAIGPKSAPRKASRPRTAPSEGTTGTGTAARVARLKAEHPDMTNAAIAKRLRVSVRTVSRHLNLPDADPTGTTPTTTTDPSATSETGGDVSRAA